MRSTFIGKLDIFHWSHRVILSVSTNWFWYWKYWIWMSRHMLSRHIGWAVIIYADIGLAAMLAIMYLPTFTTTYILYIWHTVRVWKCIPDVIHLELFVIRYINMLLLYFIINNLKENVTIVLEVYVLLTKDQMGKVSIYISFFSNLIYNVYACNTKSFIHQNMKVKSNFRKIMTNNHHRGLSAI